MRKVIYLVLAALGLLVLFRVGKWGIKNHFTTATPQTLTTRHFAIHYRDVSRWDAEAVADGLEENYRRILQDLWVSAHPQTQVYIHPTKEAFTSKVGFYAMGVIRGVDTLHLLKPASLLVDVLFPVEEVAVHEFAHAVTLNQLLQEATRKGRIKTVADFEKLYEKEGKRFDQMYPRWLWESVAVYEAGQYNNLVANLTVKNGFPTLAQLNEHNNLVYNLGYTIIDYVIKTHGKDKLMALLHSNGNTELVLGLTEAAFEQEWIAFVKKQYWVFL